MESLVHDLLAYTRASDLSDPPVEPVDVDQALERSLSNLQVAIELAGASITSGTLPSVRVHEVHLEQLFQNLIGNAIKYRGEAPPQIEVDARRGDGEWIFSIKDNGIGIDPQYKEHIFGIFRRLHSPAEYSGTGIGLAICQRIIERCGGRIWVESELGQGATFFFAIPDEAGDGSRDRSAEA